MHDGNDECTSFQIHPAKCICSVLLVVMKFEKSGHKLFFALASLNDGKQNNRPDSLNRRYSVIELVENNRSNRRKNYRLIRVIEDFRNLRKL